MKSLAKFAVIIGLLLVGIICLFSIADADKQPNDCNNLIYLHADTNDNQWMNAEKNDPASNVDYVRQRWLGNGDVTEEFFHIPGVENTIKLESGKSIKAEIHIDITEGFVTDIAFTLYFGETELGTDSETAVGGDNTYQFEFNTSYNKITENLRANITFTFNGVCEYRIYTEGSSWINLPILQEPPEIYNVKVTEITKDSAIIYWETNEYSDSLVLYNETLPYNKTKADIDLVKVHQIKLTGLELQTLYHFCVCSSDANGNKNQSSDFIFKTAWVVRGIEERENEVIELSTNLIIEDKGELTFQNVTLKMNCSYDGEFGIEVKDGGGFYIYDGDNNIETDEDCSIITSSSKYGYSFYVRNGAKFEMKNSKVNKCGYKALDHGLTIESDDVLIESNIISNNYDGIICKSNATILNNEIFDNKNNGIDIYSSNPKIINNKIYENDFAIYSSNSNAEIKGNKIMNNRIGIYCSKSPTISGNTINENKYGIKIDYGNPKILNNLIFDNEEGIECFDSNITIFNTTFQNNDACIISYGFVKENIIKIFNSTFSDNNEIVVSQYSNITLENSNILIAKGFGFELFNASSLFIKNSTITNSGQYDFRIFEFSNVTTLNTTFNKNKVELDEGACLIVKWYLNLKVIDPNNYPAKNAKIRIKDNENGTFDKNYTSDSKGLVYLIECLEYIQNSTDKKFYTPYQIKAEKGLDFGEAKVDLTKTMTKEIFLKDNTPPEIYDVSWNAGDTFAVISWNTNEKSDSKLKYGLNESYEYITFKVELVKYHSIKITDLIPETVYHFQIICKDADSNLKESNDFIFTTAPDSTPPKIFDVKNSVPTANSVIITWKTNENSTSQVEFGINAPNMKTLKNNTLTISHWFELTSLLPNQTYYYRVISEDKNKNENISEIYSFRTKELAPTLPPNITLKIEVDITNPIEKEKVKVTAKIKNNGEIKLVFDVIFMDEDKIIENRWDNEIGVNKTISFLFIWTAKNVGLHNLKVVVEHNGKEIANATKEVVVKKEVVVDVIAVLEIEKYKIKVGEENEISAKIINNADNQVTLEIIIYDNNKEINKTTKTIENLKTFEFKNIWKADKEGKHTIKVVVKHNSEVVVSESKVIDVEKKEGGNKWKYVAIGSVIGIFVVAGIFIFWWRGLEYEE